MLRYYFTLTTVLLFSISKAQINADVKYEYIVFYNYIFQPDKFDSTKKVTEKMMLLSGNDYSHYLSHNRYLSDSTLKAIETEAEKAGTIPSFNMQNRPPRAIINHQVFKMFKTDQYYFHNTIGVQQPCFIANLPTLNWQTTEETKTILGYDCKKATTAFAGRNYIAWYTTAIPITDGPYKFYGLPGLILEISDTENHHTFNALSIEKKDKKIALNKKEGQQVHLFNNEADYNDYINKLKGDPALMFQQNLIQIPPDAMEKVVTKVKEDLKKQNNPIELK